MRVHSLTSTPYGQRGTSLANLATISATIKIFSKVEGQPVAMGKVLSAPTCKPTNPQTDKGLAHMADPSVSWFGEIPFEDNSIDKHHPNPIPPYEANVAALLNKRHGTYVKVEGFMHNLPVRQRSMNKRTEFDRVIQTVSRLSILRPQTLFVVHDCDANRVLLRLPRSSSILSRLAQLLGPQRTLPLVFSRQASPCGNYRVAMYLASGHHSRDMQFIFVNGRTLRRPNALFSFMDSFDGVSRRKDGGNTMSLEFSGKDDGSFTTSASSFAKSNLVASQYSATTGKKRFDATVGLPPPTYLSYVMEVTCPLNFASIVFEPNRVYVEFSDWAALKNTITSVVHAGLGVPESSGRNRNDATAQGDANEADATAMASSDLSRGNQLVNPNVQTTASTFTSASVFGDGASSLGLTRLTQSRDDSSVGQEQSFAESAVVQGNNRGRNLGNVEAVVASASTDPSFWAAALSSFQEAQSWLRKPQEEQEIAKASKSSNELTPEELQRLAQFDFVPTAEQMHRPVFPFHSSDLDPSSSLIAKDFVQRDGMQSFVNDMESDSVHPAQSSGYHDTAFSLEDRAQVYHSHRLQDRTDSGDGCKECAIENQRNRRGWCSRVDEELMQLETQYRENYLHHSVPPCDESMPSYRLGNDSTAAKDTLDDLLFPEVEAQDPSESIMAQNTSSSLDARFVDMEVEERGEQDPLGRDSVSRIGKPKGQSILRITPTFPIALRRDSMPQYGTVYRAIYERSNYPRSLSSETRSPFFQTSTSIRPDKSSDISRSKSEAPHSTLEDTSPDENEAVNSQSSADSILSNSLFAQGIDSPSIAQTDDDDPTRLIAEGSMGESLPPMTPLSTHPASLADPSHRSPSRTMDATSCFPKEAAVSLSTSSTFSEPLATDTSDSRATNRSSSANIEEYMISRSESLLDAIMEKTYSRDDKPVRSFGPAAAPYGLHLRKMMEGPRRLTPWEKKIFDHLSHSRLVQETLTHVDSANAWGHSRSNEVVLPSEEWGGLFHCSGVRESFVSKILPHLYSVRMQNAATRAIGDASEELSTKGTSDGVEFPLDGNDAQNTSKVGKETAPVPLELFRELGVRIDEKRLASIPPEAVYQLWKGSAVTKKMLQHIEVVGQLDSKFILCTVALPEDPTSSSTEGSFCASGGNAVREQYMERHPYQLVLLDQHAVDERIRLELLEEALFGSAKSTFFRWEDSLDAMQSETASNDTSTSSSGTARLDVLNDQFYKDPEDESVKSILPKKTTARYQKCHIHVADDGLDISLIPIIKSRKEPIIGGMEPRPQDRPPFHTPPGSETEEEELCPEEVEQALQALLETSKRLEKGVNTPQNPNSSPIRGHASLNTEKAQVTLDSGVATSDSSLPSMQPSVNTSKIQTCTPRREASGRSPRREKPSKAGVQRPSNALFHMARIEPSLRTYVSPREKHILEEYAFLFSIWGYNFSFAEKASRGIGGAPESTSEPDPSVSHNNNRVRHIAQETDDHSALHTSRSEDSPHFTTLTPTVHSYTQESSRRESASSTPILQTPSIIRKVTSDELSLSTDLTISQTSSTPTNVFQTPVAAPLSGKGTRFSSIFNPSQLYSHVVRPPTSSETFHTPNHSIRNATPSSSPKDSSSLELSRKRKRSDASSTSSTDPVPSTPCSASESDPLPPRSVEQDRNSNTPQVDPSLPHSSQRSTVFLSTPDPRNLQSRPNSSSAADSDRRLRHLATPLATWQSHSVLSNRIPSSSQTRKTPLRELTPKFADPRLSPRPETSGPSQNTPPRLLAGTSNIPAHLVDRLQDSSAMDSQGDSITDPFSDFLLEIHTVPILFGSKLGLSDFREFMTMILESDIAHFHLLHVQKLYQSLPSSTRSTETALASELLPLVHSSTSSFPNFSTLSSLRMYLYKKMVAPPAVFRILCSKACRGAVMFGDPLTYRECVALICNLRNTKYPFQCAHGRPSVVPLLALR